MVCSRAAHAEESEERAPARPADHECNILRVADRDPMARFARTLRPIHERVQSVQPRGVWKRIFDALAAKSRDSLYLIDSTIVKAHRAASGAKGGRRIRRLASAVVGGPRKSMRSSMARVDH